MYFNKKGSNPCEEILPLLLLYSLLFRYIFDICFFENIVRFITFMMLCCKDIAVFFGIERSGKYIPVSSEKRESKFFHLLKF